MSTDQEIEDMTDEDQGVDHSDETEVSTPVAELVAAALDGNSLRVQEMFNMLVIDRIQAMIEERKPYVAQTLIVPEDVDEDEDTVDEDVEDDSDEDDQDETEAQ